MICAGITLDGNIITIAYHADDGTRGASMNDPYVFEDVYDTSISNGWNVEKNGNSYYIPYSIYISGVTYFKSQYESIFQEITGAIAFYITTTGEFLFSYSHFRYPTYGKFIRIDAEGTIDGCSFDYYRLYYFGGKSAEAPLVVNNTVVSRVQVMFVPYTDSFVEFNNVEILNSIYSLCPSYAGIFNNVKIVDSTYAFYFYTLQQNIIFNNIQTLNVLYGVSFRPGRGSVENPIIATFIDCAFNFNSYGIMTVATGYQIVDAKSTFKINIENGDGGTAKLYDQNNNLIWSEVLSGEFEKEVSYYIQHVETVPGEIIKDEKTTYEPFKLVISKSGYQDLVIPGIIITPGDQTDIFGILKPPTYADPIPEVKIDEEPTTIALIEVETE